MAKTTQGLSEKKYANFVSVTATPTEVFLLFKLLSPETPNVEKAESVVTVTLPPTVAIALISAMKGSIGKQIALLKEKQKEKEKEEKKE
ncbi:MAG: hypothetical protein MUC35_06505 [Candidatus Margulisbacteria bacterium]|jgi:hypothetical protein|nr:hypothetical protein [Candidatus Margulisiibacteriota bacterium]